MGWAKYQEDNEEIFFERIKLKASNELFTPYISEQKHQSRPLYEYHVRDFSTVYRIVPLQN